MMKRGKPQRATRIEHTATVPERTSNSDDRKDSSEQEANGESSPIRRLHDHDDDDDDDDCAASAPEDDIHEDERAVVEFYPRDDNEDDAVSTATKEEKPGIVYVASLVPGMTPGVVKSVLGKHASIKRLFLQPEDPSVRKRRIAAGGHSGMRYTEGWVEFFSKKAAKRLAALLNGSRVGPRKSSRFYDDYWVMKYLRGFTWAMLVEKSSFERRQREARLKLEVMREKKTDEAFLRTLDKSKQINAMEAKHKKVGGGGGADGGDGGERGVKRSFKQVTPILGGGESSAISSSKTKKRRANDVE